MKVFLNIISKLRYWLLLLLVLPFLCPSFSYAEDDLMWQIMEPAYYRKSTLNVWESVSRVWKNVLHEWGSIKADLGWVWVADKPSIITKVTRVLLALVIALSVTMILYNGMSYIIQTWQGKEWKNLVKNVVYIVIWILLSLFSVTIITLLESVSTTLYEDTADDWQQEIDQETIWGETKWIKWSDLFNKFKL
jgi:hypothetical protein